MTPFIGAGLVALVVYSDPGFARLAWADAVAVAIAAAVILVTLLPIDWDRLPRLTIAAPLVVGIAFGLAAHLNSQSPVAFVALVVAVVVVAGIYVTPWDRLPRLVHNLPLFGGVAAVVVFEATIATPSQSVPTAILIFPLILTTILFGALHHTRDELLLATGAASVGLVLPALLDAGSRGGLATSTLVVVVLWVVAVTVHEVVQQSRTAAAAAEHMAGEVKSLFNQLEATNVLLRQASETKSDFLAKMSHELRTPLNSILGFSDLLLIKRKDEYDDATRLRFLEQINSSGRHLLGLINDILDLSKIEAGQMVLHIESVSLGDVAREVMSTMEPLASAKGIRLVCDVAAVDHLPADAGKLMQMLLNLVSNAVKFTNEGGLVRIGARRLPNMVEISVTDTGIGIAESDRRRLFGEFQQLDSKLGRAQEGTGLGLTLTKRFAELHGGEVRVTSEPGKGSVFVIRLPAEPAAPEPPAPPPPVAEDDSRPLVLIVDDNPQAAHLLARQLDHGGFRSALAHTGDEALAMARRLEPIAITLDILLPGIDGWEVLTQLKRDPATRDIPVVVISVLDDREVGRALGAIDYFVKPVDADALLQRLARYTYSNVDKVRDIRVLAIDDEPANLEWLERTLQPAGYSVTSAKGGREGVKLAVSSRPNLILLDLLMPEMSGFEVVEALRADDSTRSIPIMILTAKELTSQDRRDLRGHVSAILGKGSTSATDLLVWLQRLLTTRTAA